MAHVLSAFERCAAIDGIALIGQRADFERFREIAKIASVTKPLLFAEGGSTRQESVFNGLLALPESAEIVAIHDAARPLVSSEVIERTVRAARSVGAALAVAPVTDTVKRIGETDLIEETIPRDRLRAAQTPQTFRVSLILEAHRRAREEGATVTDDASLAERYHHPVLCVEGDRRNLKITAPEDLRIAEALMSESPAPFASPAAPRIGGGYDIHRLVKGRRLVLGGVEIPHESGLDGHSDADAPLHALMDALLGAAGLDDIGHLFPNSDERWLNADSRIMLRQVRDLLDEKGYAVGNVDLTILAERPKVAPYLSAMKAAIAEDLRISVESVGLKATTNEKVGAVGREEAIAALATVLLFKY